MVGDVELTYLDAIAEKILANVPVSELPNEEAMDLFRIYAVLLLAKGRGVEAADVHNAWVSWMTAKNPAHESLIPYDGLSKSVADHDKPFLDAIRRVALDHS